MLQFQDFYLKNCARFQLLYGPELNAIFQQKGTTKQTQSNYVRAPEPTSMKPHLSNTSLIYNNMLPPFEFLSDMLKVALPSK